AKIAPKGTTAVSDGATTLWKKSSGDVAEIRTKFSVMNSPGSGPRRYASSGRPGFFGVHQPQGFVGQLAQQPRQFGDVLAIPVRQQRSHDLLPSTIQGGRHRAPLLGDRHLLDARVDRVGLAGDETELLEFRNLSTHCCVVAPAKVRELTDGQRTSALDPQQERKQRTIEIDSRHLDERRVRLRSVEHPGDVEKRLA